MDRCPTGPVMTNCVLKIWASRDHGHSEGDRQHPRPVFLLKQEDAGCQNVSEKDVPTNWSKSWVTREREDSALALWPLTLTPPPCHPSTWLWCASPPSSWFRVFGHFTKEKNLWMQENCRSSHLWGDISPKEVYKWAMKKFCLNITSHLENEIKNHKILLHTY